MGYIYICIYIYICMYIYIYILCNYNILYVYSINAEFVVCGTIFWEFEWPQIWHGLSIGFPRIIGTFCGLKFSEVRDLETPTETKQLQFAPSQFAVYFFWKPKAPKSTKSPVGA